MPSIRTLVPALSALVLSACVVTPYAPAYRAQASYDEPVTVAEVPPPPPQVEVVPVVPFPGAIWIGGYWGWGGGRHAWVPGHWERPRAGFVWAPYRWVPFRGHWQLRAGGWIRG
jgi:hypothetical protein